MHQNTSGAFFAFCAIRKRNLQRISPQKSAALSAVIAFIYSAKSYFPVKN